MLSHRDVDSGVAHSVVAVVDPVTPPVYSAEWSPAICETLFGVKNKCLVEWFTNLIILLTINFRNISSIKTTDHNYNSHPLHYAFCYIENNLCLHSQYNKM